MFTPRVAENVASRHFKEVERALTDSEELRTASSRPDLRLSKGPGHALQRTNPPAVETHPSTDSGLCLII